MATGKVKWFQKDKGYGFITEDKTDVDFFVHFTGIVGEGFKYLVPAQVVSFEKQKTPKGWMAVEVVKL